MRQRVAALPGRYGWLFLMVALWAVPPAAWAGFSGFYLAFGGGFWSEVGVDSELQLHDARGETPVKFDLDPAAPLAPQRRRSRFSDAGLTQYNASLGYGHLFGNRLYLGGELRITPGSSLEAVHFRGDLPAGRYRAVEEEQRQTVRVGSGVQALIETGWSPREDLLLFVSVGYAERLFTVDWLDLDGTSYVVRDGGSEAYFSGPLWGIGLDYRIGTTMVLRLYAEQIDYARRQIGYGPVVLGEGPLDVDYERFDFEQRTLGFGLLYRFNELY